MKRKIKRRKNPMREIHIDIGSHNIRRNPLHAGYSRETISKNIRKLLREGRRNDVAIAAALSNARRSFKARHPRRKLPAHLTHMKIRIINRRH